MSAPRTDSHPDARSARPAFTIDVPAPADAPALARVHVRGWEVAYSHALTGEEAGRLADDLAAAVRAG